MLACNIIDKISCIACFENFVSLMSDLHFDLEFEAPEVEYMELADE